MVLADYLRVKLVAPLRESLRAEGRVEGHAEGRLEGHAEGRAEARVEAHRIWREWNRRRREAEARGETFDEPEPDAVND